MFPSLGPGNLLKTKVLEFRNDRGVLSFLGPRKPWHTTGNTARNLSCQLKRNNRDENLVHNSSSFVLGTGVVDVDNSLSPNKEGGYLRSGAEEDYVKQESARMILDSKQPYFDADGVRSAGRLRFYLCYDNTCNRFQKAIRSTIPLWEVVALTSAGDPL